MSFVTKVTTTRTIAVAIIAATRQPPTSVAARDMVGSSITERCFQEPMQSATALRQTAWMPSSNMSHASLVGASSMSADIMVGWNIPMSSARCIPRWNGISKAKPITHILADGTIRTKPCKFPCDKSCTSGVSTTLADLP